MKNRLLILSTALLFLGCSDNSTNESQKSEIKNGTLASSMEIKKGEANSSGAEPENSESGNQHKTAIQLHLEELNKQYADLPNPFIAKFDGFSLGDYAHVMFSNDENIYDFGDGDNNYEGVDKDEFLKEDSKLIGKKFKVYWAWQVSSFYCCSGEMDTYKEKVPSIVKLELVK